MFCVCCGDEIKCPFSVRDGTPEDLVGRKGSFLNDAGLIHSHKYYSGQLRTGKFFARPRCLSKLS